MYLNRHGYLVATVVVASLSVACNAPIVASAQPPGFPDLSRFTETTQTDLKQTTRSGGHSALFRTPDGLVCKLDSAVGECRGSQSVRIPGYPADAPFWPPGGAQQCLIDTVVYDSDSPGKFRTESMCDDYPYHLLPAGEKITIGTGVCAIGNDGLTACTNGTHGFVIQASGTQTF
ncbi:Uncharacterised protein [Mycobacteroides abscessus subsp. abscessus]|nr:Uncharacterised protein [Mycobacteroides abscessus subsp. abscessus]